MNIQTQYSSLTDARRWNIANAALVGINLILILPFTLLILRTRSLRDPSRRWLKWLKLAFWLFFITLALTLTNLIISLLALHDYPITLRTARAMPHLSYLASLFDTLSAAAAMIFLFELGPGIRHATKGSFRSHDKLTRYGALFLGFVVAVLAISYYGLMVDLNENYSDRLGRLDWFSFGGLPGRRARAVRDLVAATKIILFVASLMILGVAAWTWTRRRFGILKSVSTMYLVAALLYLVSQTWEFAYTVRWLLMDRVHENYVFVLQAILGWWMRGFMLIVGYLIAKRSAERGGVWSVPVPYKGTAVPAGARGYTGGDYRMSQSTY